jgi:hypothetical protein
MMKGWALLQLMMGWGSFFNQPYNYYLINERDTGFNNHFPALRKR